MERFKAIPTLGYGHCEESNGGVEVEVGSKNNGFWLRNCVLMHLLCRLIISILTKYSKLQIGRNGPILVRSIPSSSFSDLYCPVTLYSARWNLLLFSFASCLSQISIETIGFVHFGKLGSPTYYLIHSLWLCCSLIFITTYFFDCWT